MLNPIEHLAGTLDGATDRKSSDGAALPFRSSEPKPSSERGAIDMSAGLPFESQSRTEDAPPDGPDESSSSIRRISLEDYAELCLVTREYPTYAAQARKRFGVEDDASQASIHRYFQQRFTDNPAEQQQFYAAYERIRQRFAVNG